MKVLDLPLKSKWYLMIESGVKPEEYREIKPYWYLRLYQRKKEFSFLGRLTRDEAEYACDPGLRYILKGEGFKESELKGYPCPFPLWLYEEDDAVQDREDCYWSR